jgi:hypothetical protein
MHQRLTRGDAFTIFAQVTLGKTQLGESSRIECKIEENNCVLDLEVKYSLKVAEPLSFDEITKYPLLSKPVTINGVISSSFSQYL